MSSEEDRCERSTARWAKIFGALTVILLTTGIWASYNENTLCPEAIVFLTVLSFNGAALSFVGMLVMIIFMSTDNC